jgi:hypothetical protein
MIERVVFALGCAAFVFMGGMYVGWYRLPPAAQMGDGVDAARDWWTNWRSYAGLDPVKFLRPSRYPGSGVVLHDRAEVQPGVTLMTGLWDSEVGLTLRDMDGKELHRWHAAFSRLWPETPQLAAADMPANDWDTHLHGAVLYPNGDVVFNFDFTGLIRLDRCSRVVWRLPYRTHHSLTVDDDGDLWAVGIKAEHAEASPRFPGLEPPVREDTIVHVAAEDGRILREISMLDVLYGSGYEGALLTSGLRVRPGLRDPDPLHTNQAQVLSAAMAPAFPMFAAGDILVSMRNLNLLVVIDGRSERIKWARTGPWVRQHEPQFLPNGQIAVFDNRPVANVEPWSKHKPRLASRILSVDPGSGHVGVLYEGTAEHPFFTEKMGKHQYLPNANILVSEAEGGRVFEITPAGKIVWSFVNRYDDDHVAVIEQAIRYPTEYAAFAAEPCPPDNVVGSPAPAARP